MGNGRFTYTISEEAEKVIASHIGHHSNKNSCINWLVEQYPDVIYSNKTIQENNAYLKEEIRKLQSENAVLKGLNEKEKEKRKIAMEYMGIEELKQKTKTLDIRFDELFTVLSDLIPKPKKSKESVDH